METPSHRVAEFKQRAHVAGKPEDVSYGMCVGFSAAWLIRHKTHRSEGSAQRCVQMGTPTLVDSAEAIQRAYLKARTPEDDPVRTGQRGAIGAALDLVQSRASIYATEKIVFTEETMKEMWKAISVHSSHVHMYYLFMLSFGPNSVSCTQDNHVIAGYHSSGKIRGWGSHLYIFEPNFGEFKLSPGEIKGFFQDIKKSYANYTNKLGVRSPKQLQRVTIHKVLFA